MGKFEDGTFVVVKRITANIQRINLVKLLGYCCVVGGPRFLVYEFIGHGSLDAWIFPHGSKLSGMRGCLTWELRYSVAIDVAKALAYLHLDRRSKILHLDVKPENILLDEKFRAIATDFGLSKLMRKDESRVKQRTGALWVTWKWFLLSFKGVKMIFYNLQSNIVIENTSYDSSHQLMD
ncbi:hypothetical protein NE237_007289 [Protea cynaroides]|uniref:Protein kinase domain-containing protein n=1 Tax=Protea cynaroides TaxID=273540 RepID=A0A9Q0QWA7_9MAGN|nr:hypothetical protein NE237_007289 [Protea cynaroides]